MSDRCATKLRYATWDIAEREALQLMDDMRDGKLKRVKGGTVFAYSCGDHFHVGHQPLLPRAWTFSSQLTIRGAV